MGVARSGSRRCRRQSIGADCGIVHHGERSGVSHNTQQRGAAEQPEHRRHYNDTPPNTRARYVPAHRKCLLATHRRLPMTTRPRPDTGSHCTLVWPLWVYRRTLCRHTATGSHLPHWQCQGTLALRSDSATIGVKRCALLLPCTTPTPTHRPSHQSPGRHRPAHCHHPRPLQTPAASQSRHRPPPVPVPASSVMQPPLAMQPPLEMQPPW